MSKVSMSDRSRRILGLVLAAGLCLASTGLSKHAAAQDHPTNPTPVASEMVASEMVASAGHEAWLAAKAGDEPKMMEALKRAVGTPSIEAAAGTNTHAVAALDQSIAKREKTRTEKVAEVETKLTEKLKEQTPEALSESIKLAVERFLLSPDRAAFMKEPRIVELIKRGDEAARAAEAKGDWFTANELFYRLNVLLEEEGAYKPDVKRLGLRLSMIRLYVPEQFWKLRNDERIAAKKPGLPPYNGLGEDFKSKLDGIDKRMVFTAIAAASRSQIDKVPLREMILGGLESIRTMTTTSDLQKAFPNLANPAAHEAMLTFLNSWSQQISAPDAVPNNQTLLDLLDDLLATNRTTVAFPDNAVLHEFGNGAMGKLDDFSAIIWPDELSRFNRMTEGKFIGVGIQIQMDDETQMIKVVTPLEGTPAQQAGIKAGDLIKKINGQSAVGISLNQAVDQITGHANSNVTITVERETGKTDEKGDKLTEDLDFPLVRRTIPQPSVKGWRRLGPKEDQWDWFVDSDRRIGYIRLLQFTDDTTTDLRNAIDAMKSAPGGLNGLVLDLRYNPGGLLTEAVSVSNTFIDKGTIVSTQGVANVTPSEVKSAIAGESMLGSLPLVVLINEGSASASEIVSGAIRHYADKGEVNAVVLGQRSFGKGSVQNVWPLAPNAKMKLTTQYYKLPDGRILHKKPGQKIWGVDPHLSISMLPEQESDALKLRQDADVMAIDANGNVVEDKPRPDPKKLIEDGVDLQLQTALVLLQLQTGGTAQAAKTPPESSIEKP